MSRSLARSWAFSTIALTTLLAPGSAARELPPEVQVDRLLVQAEREIEDGEHWSAVFTFERILAVSEEHGLEVPVEFWFRQAGVLQGAGLHELAIEASTRYLQEAGREVEHYRAALEILDAAEKELSIRAQEAARRQQLQRLDATVQELVGQLPMQGPRRDVMGKPYVETTTELAIRLAGCRLGIEIVSESTPPTSGNLIRAWQRVDAIVGRENRIMASIEESRVYLVFAGESVRYGSNKMDGVGTSTVLALDADPSAVAATELVAAFNRIDRLCARAFGG